MNRKLFCLLSLIIILSLVTGSAGVLAHGPQPPKPVVPPGRASAPRSPVYPRPGAQPLRLQPHSIDQANAPSVELGQPGLSFRYIETFGETGVPYFTDTVRINRPSGLYLNVATGDMYVVESYGQRLLKYNASRQQVLSIGKAGICYTDDYVFCGISDVALNAGTIWVSDGPRVAQYAQDGTLLQQFPAVDPWLAGNDNDRFEGASGLAFDANNHLFVSDSGNQRIQVFDISGGTPVYSTTIGLTDDPGTAPGRFNNPNRIAVDSNGDLYVADWGNNRLQECEYSLGEGWSCSVLDDTLNHPEGVTVAPNGDVYVADTQNVRIRKCSTGVCTDFITEGAWLADLVVDADGNVYGSDAYGAIVGKYDSDGVYQEDYLGFSYHYYLTDNAHFNQPRIAVDTTGNMLVIEEQGQRLLKLDSHGNFLWSVGDPGHDDCSVNQQSLMCYPGEAALDNSGNIYVANSNHIKIFDSDGSYLGKIGEDSGDPEFVFTDANGVAVDQSGKVYVADIWNHRVQIYQKTGTSWTSWQHVDTIGYLGFPGSDNFHLNAPSSVTLDAAGNVYVADSGNCRVQKFDNTPQHDHLMTYGVTGSCTSALSDTNAQDVSVDTNGRVYVSGWDDRVQVFDNSGAYLTTIGGAWGENTSQFRGASSVALDSQSNVYVADWGNHRIQKYAPGVPGWRQSNINGFGNRYSTGVLALEVFNDQLYAGTMNWNNGGSIWRSPDGSSWTAVTEPGFGSVYTNTNPFITDLIVFNGQLYAGSGWDGEGGQVWRSPDGTTWTKVVDNGFGDPNNKAIVLFTVFNDNLYACTRSEETHGLEIWRSATGNLLDWSQVASNGFDGNPKNVNCTGFAIFNGYLYASTESVSGNPDGIEIWRTNNGNSWVQVNDTGFGDPDNFSAGGMAIYQSFLYVGTENDSTGAQIWRSSTGTNWELVTGNGFGDSNNYKIDTLYVFDNKLYAGADNNQTGVEIWRTSDGSNWHQINPDGFGDSNNVAIVLWQNGITSFNDSLYMGTWNDANGGELWQLLKQLYLPMLKR